MREGPYDIRSAKKVQEAGGGGGSLEYPVSPTGQSAPDLLSAREQNKFKRCYTVQLVSQPFSQFCFDTSRKVNCKV